jgi:hypothetical protein
MWRAFPRMHEGEQVYYVTDGSLAALAETLSCTSPPLITLDLSRAAEGHVLRGLIALTDSGPAGVGRSAGQSRDLRHRSLVGRRAFADRWPALAMG